MSVYEDDALRRAIHAEVTRRVTPSDRLRRALARPNEATHPVELPDRERFTPLVDLVRETGEEDPCQVCHEPGTVDDPVGHFKNPAQVGTYVMAHGDCGEANGLKLA